MLHLKSYILFDGVNINHFSECRTNSSFLTNREKKTVVKMRKKNIYGGYRQKNVKEVIKFC